MRTRAAAALQKVLTFQDVRERVADVAPSAVAPLVELLQQDCSSKQNHHESGQPTEVPPTSNRRGDASGQAFVEQNPRADVGVLFQQEHDMDQRKCTVRSREGKDSKGAEDRRSPNAPYQLDNKVIHAVRRRSWSW